MTVSVFREQGKCGTHTASGQTSAETADSCYTSLGLASVWTNDFLLDRWTGQIVHCFHSCPRILLCFGTTATKRRSAICVCVCVYAMLMLVGDQVYEILKCSFLVWRETPP